jgi:hypothetical protein
MYKLHYLYHLLCRFQAEKLNITFVSPSTRPGLLSGEDKEKVKATQEKNRQLLRIPRRLSSKICFLLFSILVFYFIVCLSICLSIYLSVYLSVYLPICLSSYLFIRLSVTHSNSHSIKDLFHFLSHFVFICHKVHSLFHVVL